jgi:hypothetical protein
MEVVIFCITLTAIMCVCLVAMGYVVGREVNDDVIDKNSTERTNDVDSDIRVYVPSRDRDRSGNQRDNPQVDEVISVLDTLSVGASSEEKAALDYAKECIDIAHKLAKYFKGETE